MKSLILVLTLIYLSISLQADQIKELKQASLANVKALIILTTQDMLTSGRYTLSRVDLMVERVVGEGIRGYNIGLGAGVTF